MKKIIAMLLAISVITPAFAANTKTICRDKVIKGKTVKQCKTIKIHKKYQGTKVPTQNPNSVTKKSAPKKM